MEQRLIQTQTHKLILAPQLRQFLKLLELPLLELEQRIDQELEQNPALEEVGSDSEEDLSANLESEQATNEKEGVQDLLQQMETIERVRAYNDLTTDYSQVEPEENQKRRDYQESILTKPPTLNDYLEWQLSLLDLSDSEKNVAEEIIGNIDDDGYLAVPLEEIAQATNSTHTEAERVLGQIQSLDPPGVGGRNLSEVLLIQLKKQSHDTSLAQGVIKEHLGLLKRKQFDHLARLFNVSPQRIKEIYHDIARLEPKPGRIFYQEKNTSVIPDGVVSISPDQEDELVLEINQRDIPPLRINPLYREMLKKKDLDPATRSFLKEKVQAGLDLIRAIAQRKSTLQLITEELLKQQRDFFTKGFAFLRPLRLKDIAEKIGVHESTVSRAIQAKYLDTPQGTIPYKSFFSNRLESNNGASESQKSAMEKLKNFIASEDKNKPLSDAKLVHLLNQEGVKIARRTVAKYRDLLKILPAYLRKK